MPASAGGQPHPSNLSMNCHIRLGMERCLSLLVYQLLIYSHSAGVVDVRLAQHSNFWQCHLASWHSSSNQGSDSQWRRVVWRDGMSQSSMVLSSDSYRSAKPSTSSVTGSSRHKEDCCNSTAALPGRQANVSCDVMVQGADVTQGDQLIASVPNRLTHRPADTWQP